MPRPPIRSRSRRLGPGRGPSVVQRITNHESEPRPIERQAVPTTLLPLATLGSSSLGLLLAGLAVAKVLLCSTAPGMGCEFGRRARVPAGGHGQAAASVWR